MRHAEGGQSLVEAVAVVPLCLVCALALVDAGVLVRDRIATSHAATRAAEAALAGRDARDAALGALPGSLEAGAEVDVDDARAEVVTTSRPALLKIPGGVEHRSTARIADDEKDGGAR